MQSVENGRFNKYCQFAKFPEHMLTAPFTLSAVTKWSRFALFGLLGVGLCVAFRMLVKWDSNDEDDKKSIDVETSRLITKLIKIPAESVGRVIGRCGRNLRQTEKDTKVRRSEDQNVEEVEDSSIDMGANNVSHPTFGFRCLKIRGGTPKQNRLAHLAIYGNVAESEIPQVTRYMLVPEHAVEAIV
ncbi:hypothetical protein KIN20_010269, partial [Parelaphostrongylus tenuis]